MRIPWISALFKMAKKRLAVDLEFAQVLRQSALTDGVAPMRFMKGHKIRVAAFLQKGTRGPSRRGKRNIPQTLQNALEARPLELRWQLTQCSSRLLEGCAEAKALDQAMGLHALLIKLSLTRQGAQRGSNIVQTP